MVFESQLSRRNCQTFSTGLSSGHLGGSGSSVILAGTFSAAEAGQRLALCRTQQRHLSRSLAIDQPIRAARVEPQNPVAHRLQPHAPGVCGFPACATRVNHRQSQKPAHLSRI